MESESTCASCGSEGLRTVARIDHLPVHVGVLWPSEEAARACPTGEMHLGFCPRCGLLSNTAFDPDLLDYTLEYDNSLHASAIFRDFEAALVDDLVSKYDLHGRRIVEVGSGEGRFLGLLCEAGGNTGLGFDPSVGSDRMLADGSVEIRAQYFSSGTDPGPFDLLCCRQVLEHIVDLHGFLEPIRSTISSEPDAVAYFDVPNSNMLLRDLSVWDLIYEHCHYFVQESLEALARSSGFGVQRCWDSFNGQFVSAELGAATGGDPGPDTASAGLVAAVEAFGEHLEARRAEWVRRLEEMRQRGRTMAVWGAGARAVTFFSMLGITDEVEYLIDSNPKKQGTHLAGSGHAIHPPERLVTHPVDTVVLVNGVYREEIGDQVAILNPDSELVVA